MFLDLRPPIPSGSSAASMSWWRNIRARILAAEIWNPCEPSWASLDSRTCFQRFWRIRWIGIASKVIRLTKEPEPAILVANGDRWRQEYLDLRAGLPGAPAA